MVLTTGVTNAAPERSFSLARRVNALAILHSHKDIAKKLSLVAVCNDFVDNLPNRRNKLGTFSGSDLH